MRLRVAFRDLAGKQWAAVVIIKGERNRINGIKISRRKLLAWHPARTCRALRMRNTTISQAGITKLKQNDSETSVTHSHSRCFFKVMYTIHRT